jgi:hypothetical protein
MTIWKYQLPIVGGSQQVAIPPTARVLTAQMQGGVPTMWVLLDPTHAVAEPRWFRWKGTGWELPDTPGEYVATVQDGALVFHLFETTGTEVR